MLLNYSCGSDKHNDRSKVELQLYTTNSMLPFNDGVPITDVGNFQDRDSIFINRARFDTIGLNQIHGGKFHIETSDLSEKPLLSDGDFLGFDFKSNELLLSPNAMNKLNTLNIDPLWNKQFILMADNEFILKGYLYDHMSSSIIYDDFILMPDPKRSIIKKDTLRLKVGSCFTIPMEKGNGLDYDYSKDSLFYNVFKNRNSKSNDSERQ